MSPPASAYGSRFIHHRYSHDDVGALNAATVAVLEQLGWLDARQREELRPWRAEAIANLRGTQVGERRPAFKLVAG